MMKDFFEEEFIKSSKKNNLNISNICKDYIVSVLCDFAKNENLMLTDDDLPFPLLFTLYKNGINNAYGFNEYRIVGDVSLFITGVFEEYITRRRSLVNKQYYIDMGKSGYHLASRQFGHNEFSLIFKELCYTFEDVVRVLNDLRLC